MVIDNETNILEKVKSCLEEDDLQVVTVDNNRKAFGLIDDEKENNFNLILISTYLPDTKIPAFFSIIPKSKKNIDTSKEENYLKKPFTKEQLIDFIKKRI